MLFALPDYDLACGQVISRVTKDIARESDPVLSQIKVVPMMSTVSSVLETRNDIALDLPAEPIGFELGVKAEDVRDGNFEALQVKLVEAAKGYATQLSKMSTAASTRSLPQPGTPSMRKVGRSPSRCSTRWNGNLTRTTSCQHRRSSCTQTRCRSSPRRRPSK